MGYGYGTEALAYIHYYLFDNVLRILGELQWPVGPKRVFDLGCGNCAKATALAAHGYAVTGVNLPADGVRIVSWSYRNVRVEAVSAYEIWLRELVCFKWSRVRR
jgi:predicted RNA methylase